MNAEIIAVGSELLLGQINNTNARFISNQLTELGISIYHHTVVGDNPQRLKQAIEIAESRADILIFSGGLGPTKGRTRITFCKINSTAIAVIKEFNLGALRRGLYARRSIESPSKPQKTIAAQKARTIPKGVVPKAHKIKYPA